MKFSDILSLAVRSLRANRLRSGITFTIIALGITALIGIVTAIGAINQKITESFSNMGANGFTIRFKERGFGLGANRESAVRRKGERQVKTANLAKPISLSEAERFKAQYKYPALVGIMCFRGNNNNLSFAAKQTNPTVALLGADEAYAQLNGLTIQYGRNFSVQEIEQDAAVCIVGYDVATKLFGSQPEATLGQTIRINNLPCRVIAVLKSRGATFGFSRDNIVVCGYKTVARNFGYNSFSIGIQAADIARVEEAMGEAEGLLRGIRRLSPTEESNFALERSDSVAEKAIRSLGYLTVAVIIIGIITLAGAAIGLMNIMLVAVAERTKEIGLMKAIGAPSNAIYRQFLSEAVLVSLAGSVAGIAAGIGLGNVAGWLLQTGFILPWNWIAYGVGICTLVGLSAGLYPAIQASRLSPIKALRYE